MKQVIQNYKTGELRVEDVPAPALKRGGVIVRTEASLISAGTERMKVELAQMNILQKARHRPDQVALVLNNMQQEGVLPTIQKVLNKLNTPISLGYSSAGIVCDVAADVHGVRSGDRVACIGEGYGCHAGETWVPQNFCVRVPETVSPAEAAFTGVGAIALQGVRLSRPELGNRVAVIGLGLIGQLAVQLLRAAGCAVIGIEPHQAKRELALSLGAERAFEPAQAGLVEWLQAWTHGHGVDAVVIAASSERSDLLSTAGDMVREKGRVVLLGAVPVQMPRKPYYEKEIDFVISRAFGPGSYDAAYEHGADYPHGYVRWTAARNMEAFVESVAQGRVQLAPLITNRFAIDRAEDAYAHIKAGDASSIGIILEYPQNGDHSTERARTITVATLPNVADAMTIGFVGAGSFAQGYLIPQLKKHRRVQLVGVSTTTGLSAKSVAQKFGFTYCTTDAAHVLEDPRIRTVFIATRHDSHAEYTMRALRAGKNVFLEKPLAITAEQLQAVSAQWEKTPLAVMVGLNRRFSPFVQHAKAFVEPRQGPLSIHYRVHAGPLPHGHWAKDPQQGGSRIIGELCHFVDVGHFLTGSETVRVNAYALPFPHGHFDAQDNVVVALEMRDGSHMTIQYLSCGDVQTPREYIEIFGSGATIRIENFKKAEFSRGTQRTRMKRWSRDMGHTAEIAVFLESLQTGRALPVDFGNYLWTTRTTFAIEDSLRVGQPVSIDASTCAC